MYKGNAAQIKHRLHPVACEEMGTKRDLTEFERGMIVGARSSETSINKTAPLL